MTSSIFIPPMRTVRKITMSFRLMTAISVVPPPISTIMLPVGPAIGTLAPIAAAIGSSIRKARLAPAWTAASCTARFSTLVIPAGMQIMTSGRNMDMLPLTRRMK